MEVTTAELQDFPRISYIDLPRIWCGSSEWSGSVCISTALKLKVKGRLSKKCFTTAAGNPEEFQIYHIPESNQRDSSVTVYRKIQIYHIWQFHPEAPCCSIWNQPWTAWMKIKRTPPMAGESNDGSGKMNIIPRPPSSLRLPGRPLRVRPRSPPAPRSRIRPRTP